MGRRGVVWVLCAARYPRRGAGMTEKWGAEGALVSRRGVGARRGLVVAWVPACAGMTVGGWARMGRRGVVWVLCAARYPRRGAGKTEKWGAGKTEKWGTGMTGLLCAGVTELFLCGCDGEGARVCREV